MNDNDKTKEQLISELAEMRRRITAFEALEAEHRQTAAALDESVRRYRDLYENAPNAYFSVGSDGLIRSCNRRAEELLGYPKQELVDRPVLELYADTPQGKEKARQILKRFKTGEHISDEEMEMQKADGTPVWISLTVNSVRDAQGRVIESRSMVVDTSERTAIVAELREREEQLRSIFNMASVGVAVVDMEGRFTEFNEAWCGMLRYPREELLGMMIHDVTPPGEAVLLPWESLAREKQPRIEKRYLRKDGSEFWGDLCATMIHDQDGNPEGMVSIILDITERKQAEEALQQHNRNLALLNQVSQALTATLDLPQILEGLLRAAIEITDSEGSSVWLWDDDHAGALVCRAILLDGVYRSPSDLRLQSGQGIAGWVMQTGRSASVPDVHSDPRFYSGIDAQIGFHTTSLVAAPLRVHDTLVGALEVVNKRRGTFDSDDCAMVEMLAGSAAIAIENARLVRALREYGTELEARNQDLDAFAHTVAHDLKSPLARIIGFAEVLVGDYAALKEEQIRGILQRMARSGRKMNDIIDELLLWATVRQVEEIDTGSLDMAAIVAEVQGRLAELIEEYKAEVIVPHAWPAARGYGPWVEEVWVNYLTNAIQYGGQPPRVELGAIEEADGQVHFWVRDNGNGLLPEEQERLFTPFTRFDEVRTKGYGLGLSIVQRIVEKLGGEVGVNSQVGAGSVFTFTLPSVTRQ